ncbi:DUF3347 domain-containing protein [Paraflavitalea pollutisoli]|uniref:DUF3347 domain-containing protein n=1 Tax=Paraflavitalea pollutisoli TaxID=3034143 RepID=UPI0023EC7F66|nr:DUF3347 domain-containing protein [Paraflavitalea sp. H1-2-19X]
MKTFVNSMLLPLAMLVTANSFAQLSNAKTQTIKINGNCGSCEKIIEKAGNQKKAAILDWNKDTKIATITWDSTSTQLDEVLQRVALAGYDNEQFLAPDDVYAKLPACCQYQRELKPAEAKIAHSGVDTSGGHQSHGGHQQQGEQDKSHDVHNAGKPQSVSSLQAVFDGYFLLKDALVKSDATTAATAANGLLKAIAAVDMNKLEHQQHLAWMKVVKEIEAAANRIAQTKDLAKQRDSFAQMAAPFAALAKVAKLANTIYYQHCPMYGNGKGANWLGRENTIRNPYYGSQMLTCGSTVETITN